MASDFFRDKYRKILGWVTFLIAFIVLLIGVIIYLILFRASPDYFVSTSEGRIIPISAVKTK
jgi:hypothetical protein